MTLLEKILGKGKPQPAASRTGDGMSEEEKEMELNRLKELSEQGPSEQDHRRFQRRIAWHRAEGKPLSATAIEAEEALKERMSKRHRSMAA